MTVLAWIVLGLIAGWIASVVTKTNYSHGLLTDLILGVAGAIVGGLFMNLIGQSGVTGFNLYSALVAIIGAILLIYIGRAITYR
ncbi:MAG TPA: GlsB/YeaQ/YmgE family stress response membrane protein [Patescibacteria group bacterium]|nr:GlsB/YeaQ/YmgE family stress response membrane protein [Patescibacteria group bacterium]